MKRLRLLPLAGIAVGALMAFQAQASVTVVGLPAGDFTGVSMTEEPGQYTLINNSAEAVIYGVGVTNPNSTLAHLGHGNPVNPYQDSGPLVVNGISDFSNYWGSLVLTESDWNVFTPSGDNPGNTMEDIFGAWNFGTDVVNWYEIFDAIGVGPSSTVTNLFFAGTPKSEAFGLGLDNNDVLSTFNLGQIGAGGSGPGSIPTAAPLLMLTGGLGLLLGARRFR